VIRMLEAYTGEANFMEGVRSYLKKYQYSNAAGSDLWTQIEQSSKAQVPRIMSEWIKKPGYPVVSVSLKPGSILLQQERFLLSGASEKTVWPIPLILELNGSMRKILMDKEDHHIDAPGTVESLKLNIDQTGFYRVYYDGIYEKVWQARLSPLERFGIISDAYAFTFQGRMNFGEYLGLVDRYAHEQDYIPAYEVSDQLVSLYALAPKAVKDTSRKFHSAQLKILADKHDENSVVLRGVVAARLAFIDDSYAKDRASMLQQYESTEPDMRSAIVTGFARSTGDFDTLVKNYRIRSSEEEKARFLGGLTCFSDSSLISRALQMARSGQITKQHVGTLVGGLVRNPDARASAWNWFKGNFDWLRGLYEGTGTVSRLLTVMIPYFGVGREQETADYFAKNRAPDAGMGIDAGLERLKINERFLSRINQSARQIIEVEES
jgi:tricorn protease interacting factor F2/3